MNSQDDDIITIDDLEPGDKEEKHSACDWCMAAGCGGCIDPVGCFHAASEGCAAFFEGCLAQLGCSVLVIGVLGFGIYGLVSFLF